MDEPFRHSACSNAKCKGWVAPKSEGFLVAFLSERFKRDLQLRDLQ